MASYGLKIKKPKKVSIKPGILGRKKAGKKITRLY